MLIFYLPKFGQERSNIRDTALSMWTPGSSSVKKCQSNKDFILNEGVSANPSRSQQYNKEQMGGGALVDKQHCGSGLF